METLDAIMTRRSVRSYAKGPISEEALQGILQAAMAAPSGGNRQPWAFIVVQDPRRLRGLVSLAPGIASMPSAIVAICLDKSRPRSTKDGDANYMVWMDLGAAMQNILLAAHDYGLGACAIGSFHEQGAAALLKLPPALTLALLVVIGTPARLPAGPKKRPPEEVVFFEEYGGPDGI